MLLVPFKIVEPVQPDGKSVVRASLENIDESASLDDLVGSVGVARVNRLVEGFVDACDRHQEKRIGLGPVRSRGA